MGLVIRKFEKTQTRKSEESRIFIGWRIFLDGIMEFMAMYMQADLSSPPHSTVVQFASIYLPFSGEFLMSQNRHPVRKYTARVSRWIKEHNMVCKQRHSTWLLSIRHRTNERVAAGCVEQKKRKEKADREKQHMSGLNCNLIFTHKMRMDDGGCAWVITTRSPNWHRGYNVYRAIHKVRFELIH